MTLMPVWLFERDEFLTREQVAQWWFRRLPYFNLAVGSVGVVTWLLVMLAGSAAVQPGEDFEEPLAMIFGPFIYGSMANLCYLLGPLIDQASYSGKPKAGLFKLGLYFSIVLTASPGIWAVSAWLYTVYSGHKLS